MSQPSNDPGGSLHSSKARSIYRYLHARLVDQEADELYFKCREIADDLGMSSKEIGVTMRQLQDADLDIEVEKWSWSKATTWRVKPSE